MGNEEGVKQQAYLNRNEARSADNFCISIGSVLAVYAWVWTSQLMVWIVQFVGRILGFMVCILRLMIAGYLTRHPQASTHDLLGPEL